MANELLQKYRAKRDFEKTPEPAGIKHKRHRGQPIFVVQKHSASSLHYDFRLEVDGVLKSWAVPKGPSTDPSEKRLALQTEDHPLDYAEFEGIIPEGEYGGGTVMVWDMGHYRNLTELDGEHIPAEEAIEEGHIKVWLEGDKLRGGYALTRTGSGAKARWLLVKMRGVETDPGSNPVLHEPESALSGRDLGAIKHEGAKRH